MGSPGKVTQEETRKLERSERSIVRTDDHPKEGDVSGSIRGRQEDSRITRPGRPRRGHHMEKKKAHLRSRGQQGTDKKFGKGGTHAGSEKQVRGQSAPSRNLGSGKLSRKIQLRPGQYLLDFKATSSIDATKAPDVLTPTKTRGRDGRVGRRMPAWEKNCRNIGMGDPKTGTRSGRKNALRAPGKDRKRRCLKKRCGDRKKVSRPRPE